MEGDFSIYRDENDFPIHLERFEEMLRTHTEYFFDAAIFSDIANYFIEEGDFDKAEKALTIGLGQHPQSIELFLAKAHMHMAKGDMEDALDSITIAEAFEPFNEEVYLIKGNILSQLKEHEKALSAYQEALKYAEDNAFEIYLDMAFEYEYLEDYEEAIHCLEHVLTVDPANEAALFELSFCYELADRSEDYIAFLNEYLDQEPYSYIAWYNLGAACMKEKDYKNAVFAFDYCTLIREDFSSAWLNLANSRIQLEEYEQAIEAFLSSFEHEQPNANTLTLIGECYEKMDDYEMSLHFYQRAVNTDESQTDAWIGMGIVHELNGNIKAALKYVEKALEMEEENASHWHVYAELLEKQERDADAEYAYLKALMLDAQNRDIWLDYSSFLCNAHSPERAIETLHEGLKVFPEDDLLLYRLVAYQLYGGKKNDALLNLEHALQINYFAHEDLLEYCPEARNVDDVIEMLEIYRKNEL